MDIVKRVNELARHQFLKRIEENPLINIDNLHKEFLSDLRNGQIVPAEYIENDGADEFSSLVELSASINRTKLKGLPPLPMNIEALTEELIIQAGFHQFRYGDQPWKRFLLFVEDFLQRKIICFATDEVLELLVNSTMISMDGTWKVVPQIINMNNGQLFTIHVIIEDHLCVPCVYAFLPYKTQDCYNAFFVALKAQCATRNRCLFSTCSTRITYKLTI